MLKRLVVKNYKSLHDVDIKLPAFCTLVGANAAGKSNFADAVEFLSIIARSGLPSAVTDKGGYENICFRRVRRAKTPILFRVEIDGIRINFRYDKEIRDIEFRFDFEFAFKATKQAIRSEFSVLREKLVLKTRVDENEEWKKTFSYEYDSKRKGPPIISEPQEELPFGPPHGFVEQLSKKWTESPRDNLFLTSGLGGLPPFLWLIEHLSNFRVFRVVPEAARRPASASGSLEMGKNGGNLPAALDGLQKHPKAFDQLLDCLKVAVPSVTKIETGYVETREIGLFVREGEKQRRWYASQLSDGTLRTIAIFVPVVDPRYSLIVVEEPENCIHPWVIRHFVDAARTASQSKQIILTTHSPVLVSQLEPKELLIVERDKGESKIVPAIEVEGGVDEIIREGIMDLGKYWDSGAMRAVPVKPVLFESEEE